MSALKLFVIDYYFIAVPGEKDYELFKAEDAHEARKQFEMENPDLAIYKIRELHD